ncbi:hypothetical protein [Bianquea renquensis]|uniref:Uncharacterized protein n=1 Tax=Bianquea renquensis TaxID=2763661 RepID=A0A926DRE6_9FIRM|nr:hypothetical protein [Bianquea renquensis]MBC8542427.1 hypothetical protein [Bianquea renquensis]
MNFARRLGRSASSPAGILSPSPRGATLPSQVLHAGWGALLPHRRTFSASLPVVQPCPHRFCTPAGALCFLTGGHFQPLSSWGCPALAGFARRLGRSASSPADILSPSPRGARPFLRILHAGGGLLPCRRTFSALFLVGLGPAFLNFARRLGGCFLSGGLSQPFSSWGSALPSDFARRLGGAASSPAGFLSPSPRGARPFLRILHAGWSALLPHRRTFSAPFLVGLPCPLGFCTPARALCFLSGGHFQPLSSWGCPALLDFARRLGRSASSPADILSPSPRGARPFLRILHAGWSALLPRRRTFSTLFLVGLGPSFGFCTPARALYFLSGGHSQPLSSWGCPALLDFARRLERSASSPADILSPSPRGAALPSQVLHAGWRGCFLSGGHSQPFSSWGLALPSGFARRLGGYFLSGGHSQPLSP